MNSEDFEMLKALDKRISFLEEIIIRRELKKEVPTTDAEKETFLNGI